MDRDIFTIFNPLAQLIYDKKGVNILALDIRKISTLTDFVMIAEGSAPKHVLGLGYAILEFLKEYEIIPAHIEGLQEGDWVVFDGVYFMIHLFMPGVREKYQLEELWKAGVILDLDIHVRSA